MAGDKPSAARAVAAASEAALPYMAFSGWLADPVAQRRLSCLRACASISNLATHIPADPKRWIKPAPAAAGGGLVLVEDLQVLLQAVVVVCAARAAGQTDHLVDPRVKEVIKVSETMLKPGPVAEDFYARLDDDQAAAMDLIRDWLQALRKVMLRPSLVEKAAEQRLKTSKDLRSRSASLATLARQHPGGRVLRFELYCRGQSADDALKRFRAWESRVRRLLRSKLLLMMTCPQQGQHDGECGHHVMLVIAASSMQRRLEVESAVREAWWEIAGAGAFLVPCKGLGLALRYRGRRELVDGDTLHAELMDAAVYFAQGQSIMAPIAAKSHRSLISGQRGQGALHPAQGIGQWAVDVLAARSFE